MEPWSELSTVLVRQNDKKTSEKKGEKKMRKLPLPPLPPPQKNNKGVFGFHLNQGPLLGGKRGKETQKKLDLPLKKKGKVW